VRAPLMRRLMKSPKTITVLAILGLFLSAAYIAFRQTTARSTRALLTVTPRTSAVETGPANPSTVLPVPPTVRAEWANHSRRFSPEKSVIAGNRHERRNEPSSLKREVARRPTAGTGEKQPKVVAMLKTTWRVLKRPFTF
jgi:hypothetical protein